MQMKICHVLIFSVSMLLHGHVNVYVRSLIFMKFKTLDFYDDITPIGKLLLLDICSI